MVAVTISQDKLNSLSKEELEVYLQGAGKPIGDYFTIEGTTVTWGEAEEAPLEEAPETTDDVDLTSMRKQEIIDYVEEKTGTKLPANLKKDDLIAAAVGAL
jgi:hypothetical protein